MKPLHGLKTLKHLIFLKLNFSKAYDKVDWNFLHDSMDNIEILIEFIKMRKVFFQGASASIAVNGKAFKFLVIKRGVQ
jgi:hypothetical protein